MVLKTSVASRTLDNITAVIVSFKNFRKALKAELSGVKKTHITENMYNEDQLNSLLMMPNHDLMQ